jgi:hypothetical protein
MCGVKFCPAIERGICEYQDRNFGRSGRHGNGKKGTCKEEEKEQKIIITGKINGDVSMKYHIS